MVEWKPLKLILWLTSILFCLEYTHIHAYAELMICLATRAGVGAENYTQYYIQKILVASYLKKNFIAYVV